MKSPLLVTAALIRRGDEILIAQRKANASLEALKWEFPGGKVEFGERPEDCLVREIREEIGIEIAVDRIYDVGSHVYFKSGGPGEQGSRVHVVLLFYHCRHLSGEPSCLDVQDLRWVKTADLNRFTFAAADMPIVERLIVS
jgi:8-oxo-dGTP diphosphatase